MYSKEFHSHNLRLTKSISRHILFKRGSTLFMKNIKVTPVLGDLKNNQLLTFALEKTESITG